MYNSSIEVCDELIEQRVLQVLAQGNVLPFSELKTRTGANAGNRAFRQVLEELIAGGLVRRKADRRGVWYVGYSKAQPADYAASLDDAPPPFRKLLSELAW